MANENNYSTSVLMCLRRMCLHGLSRILESKIHSPISNPHSSSPAAHVTLKKEMNELTLHPMMTFPVSVSERTSVMCIATDFSIAIHLPTTGRYADAHIPSRRSTSEFSLPFGG